MVIEHGLKQRIIRSLSWLVKDAQWRFNQVKENLDPGSAGYSPELKEAMSLLGDLEQANFAFDSGQVLVPGWSEDECKEAAKLLGYGEEFGCEFFVFYSAQNWCWSSQMPMSGDLRTNIRRSRMTMKPKTPEVMRTKSGLTPRQKYYEDYEGQNDQ